MEDHGEMTVVANRFEVFGILTSNVAFAFDREAHCVSEAQSIVVLKFVNEYWKDDLIWEEHVYRELAGAVGFPRVRWAGEWEDTYWLAMDYVGCNFERLHVFSDGEFTPRMVAAAAVQMIDRLRHLHSLGFVHGDVMPTNFTYGPLLYAFDEGVIGQPQVNLIDFGASRKCDDSGRKPLSACHPDFTSVRMTLDTLPEKRDDLESLAYTILYLALGSLPWMKSGEPEKLAKLKLTPEELCKDLPPVFSQFLRYTRELEVDVEPDYGFFMQAFAEVVEEEDPESFLYGVIP